MPQSFVPIIGGPNVTASILATKVAKDIRQMVRTHPEGEAFRSALLSLYWGSVRSYVGRHDPNSMVHLSQVLMAIMVSPEGDTP